MKMIEIHDLCFQYDKKGRAIVDGLSVCFDAGKIHVLLGLNGSGKTTLIKMLAGLLNGYSGTIRLNGKDAANLRVGERAQILSYVPQNNRPIEDFFVKDYLLFGSVNRLKFYQSPTDEDIQQLDRFAKELDIQHLLHQKMNEISGGERQLVSICCALIQNTDIIVLDEPTSALDIKNQYKILSVLKELAHREGKTVILSSHDPNHALYLNSEVYLLKNGKILDGGSAVEVICPDKLKTIYGENIVRSEDLPYHEISFL